MSNIKRSVSFYSFQDQYARGKMNLEDIFKFLKEIGAEMEFISDQMLKGTPHPSEESLKEWDRLMSKYEVKPVCNDIFINTCLYKNRTLTTKEATDALIEEIKLANRLGFKLVRLVSKTPAEIIEPALVYAEKYDVTLALEIHAGMSFDHPMTQAFIDVIHKTKSPYLGIVVDTGIFCRRHPRVATSYFRSLGANENVIKYIDDIFASGIDPKQFFAKHGGRPKELTDLYKNEADFIYSLFCDGYEASDFSILDEYMPYVKHIHGKVFEMTDEGIEYSIPYDELIKYLDEKDYNGYISTEYEGNRFVLDGEEVKELEQVKKHQDMLKKYIDKLGR
ncbi:sugar phosphate isomerase/epimerase family protein [Clostridium sp.]